MTDRTPSAASRGQIAAGVSAAISEGAQAAASACTGARAQAIPQIRLRLPAGASQGEIAAAMRASLAAALREHS